MIIMGGLRAALIDAGAAPELADKAAAEVATYEHRLAGIDTRPAVLTWMSGATLALCVTILFRVFR